MDPKFIHLNVHSDYSIKDGICKIEDLLKKCVEFEMPSIALTDFYNLSASIKFINKSYYYGIKPIIGVDIYIHYKNSFYKESHLLTILVMNNIGYKNLIKLVSLSFIKDKSKFNLNYNSIYYKLILKFHEGLIFLFSFDKFSCFGKYYIYRNIDLIKKIVLFWKKILNDRIYFHINRISYLNENIYINYIINLSYELNIFLVASNKVLFINKDDFYIHNIRCSIYHNCNIKKILNYVNYSNEQYLKTDLQMINIFKDIPEVIYNSVQISKRCNFILKKGKFILPKFNIKKNITSFEYLKKLTFKNLYKKISKKLFKKYINRLNKELEIIKKINLSNYFLIVMEFVNWSKKNKIPVGPGRGSGAGSLVAYLLGITEIDPLKFNLIFERFINLERMSIPDFDIDFCVKKRDKVLSHIEDLYGKQSVAQIVTFNTLTAKSVIRDVGRVLGYSYIFIDYIAKLIPFNIGITLNKAIQSEPKLNELYNKDIQVKKLFDISIKLEGLVKGIGKHAGGIIISSTLVYDFCPVFKDFENNKLITQFDKYDIEYIGLIKFDLLGLRTLTVIDKCVKLVYKNYKKKIDINNLYLKDKLSFNLLKKSNTIAVFQLESKGMRDLIKKLKPDCFEDIVALLALFRPGPLKSGMVDNFINRKNGNEKIYYPNKLYQHKLLIPILKYTYGIILYQEQVMQIAKVLGNYNLGLADILRRSISDKRKKDVFLHRKIFKKGSKILGIDHKLSLKIFSLMEKYSGYGFNRSHSVCYSFIAYQTLWLKANFLCELIVSVMNTDIDNINKIMSMLNEAKNNNIKIISPNINKSSYYFKIDKNSNIIYGLGAVKGIGKSSIDSILKIRKKNGKFKNFINFCILNSISNKLSKSSLESLIYSGCFDIFNINRYILYKNIKNVLKIANFENKKNNIKQLSLFKVNYFINFDFLNKKVNKNYKKDLILYKEKCFLGLYLTDHPIKKYIKYIKYKYNILYIRDINFIKINKKLNICGIITNIKSIYTKNKNQIYIINIDDSTGNLEIILFKELFIKFYKFLEINNIIIVYGIFKNHSYNYNILFFVKNILFFNKNNI